MRDSVKLNKLNGAKAELELESGLLHFGYIMIQTLSERLTAMLFVSAQKYKSVKCKYCMWYNIRTLMTKQFNGNT